MRRHNYKNWNEWCAGGEAYRLLVKLFPFLTVIIKKSLEYEKTVSILTPHMRYSQMFTDVTGEVVQCARRYEDLNSRKRSAKQLMMRFLKISK